MAIKVMGVPGEKLLDDERDATTQDFIIKDHQFLIKGCGQPASVTPRLGKGQKIATVTKLSLRPA